MGCLSAHQRELIDCRATMCPGGVFNGEGSGVVTTRSGQLWTPSTANLRNEASDSEDQAAGGGHTPTPLAPDSSAPTVTAPTFIESPRVVKWLSTTYEPINSMYRIARNASTEYAMLEENVAIVTTANTPTSNTSVQPGPISVDHCMDEIRHLYLDQNMRLKDVMAYLEVKGVRVTVKTLKTKLQRWKLFKNNRRLDVAAVLNKRRERSLAGKQTIFLRNGKPFDVQTYMKRNGIGPEDLLMLSSPGNLQPYLRCITPPIDTRLLSSPGRLSLKETLGSWFFYEVKGQADKIDLKSLTFDTYKLSPGYHAVATFSDAVWLLSREYHSQGWNRMHEAFDELLETFDGWQHYSVFCLLVISIMRPVKGVIEQLWRYMAASSEIRFGTTSIIYRVLDSLARLFSAESAEFCRDFIHPCLSGIMETVTSETQIFDMLPLWTLNPILQNRHEGCYYGHVRRWDIREISKSQPLWLKSNSHLDYLQSILLMDTGRASDWKTDTVTKAAEYLLSQSAISPFVQWHCLYTLAKYFKTHADTEGVRASHFNALAIHYLELAIDIDEYNWNPTKDYYESLAMIERWYEDAENLVMVGAVRVKMGNCLDQLLKQWKSPRRRHRVTNDELPMEA